MARQYTCDEIMHGMGFAPEDHGRYVDELRRHIQRQINGGLLYRSGGSVSDRYWTLSVEDRARIWLAFDWDAERYSSPISTIDGAPFGFRTDVRTMRKLFYIEWNRIAPWTQDRIRSLWPKLRKWIDLRLGITNPYARPTHREE